MTPPRLRVRTRLLLTIVGALALGLAVAFGAFWLVLAQRLSTSATSLARAQARTEAASVQLKNGKLLLSTVSSSTPNPSPTWLFAGDRLLVAPRASPRVQRAARALAGGPEAWRDVHGETRLYAVPLVRNGVRYGTVVSAAPLDAYEETTRTTLVGAVLLAIVLLGIAATLSWWILGRVLQPVSQMTEDAAKWSEHDLDRRFDLGEPYDELTGLAATLDNLLERIAASIRHEQRFAAELSHELRTPLARIRGEVELALGRERSADEYREALASVHRNAEQMTGTVEALVAAARHEADASGIPSDVRVAVEGAIENTRAASPSTRISATLPPDPVRVSAASELVAAMLQPLLDNAARYASSALAVEVRRNGSAVSIDVLDDGPGVGEDESERIFEPGARGRAAAGSGGAGLGLSLARRLARSAGGDVSVSPSDHGGRFSLTLPAAR
jgi:two-component system OmpR family sensor kinase